MAAVLLRAAALSAAHAMPHVVKRSETTTGTESSIFFNARHTIERFDDLSAFANALSTNTDTAILQDAVSELWISAHQHVLLHHALRKGMKLTVQAAIVLTISLVALLALRVYGL